MSKREDGEPKKYRPCAGAVLFNHEGQVFLGKRVEEPGEKFPKHIKPWQFPQGGIDKDEEPEQAAKRELHEETNVTSAKLIGEIEPWLNYDFPAYAFENGLKSKYRGQTQKWYAFLFLGQENEINVLAPMNGEANAEFSEYVWADLEGVADKIVEFKAPVYRKIVSHFADLPERIRNGEFGAK